MRKSKVMARSAVARLGVLAWAGLAHAAPEGDLSAARAMEVVNVKGSALGALKGQAFSDYSVMAVSGGKLAAIPFQFDDMNERGFPYVPGGKLKIKGAEGKLDDNDELVFMLKDTGAKASPEMLTAAGKVVSRSSSRMAARPVTPTSCRATPSAATRSTPATTRQPVW